MSTVAPPAGRHRSPSLQDGRASKPTNSPTGAAHASCGRPACSVRTAATSPTITAARPAAPRSAAAQGPNCRSAERSLVVDAGRRFGGGREQAVPDGRGGRYRGRGGLPADRPAGHPRAQREHHHGDGENGDTGRSRGPHDRTLRPHTCGRWVPIVAGKSLTAGAHQIRRRRSPATSGNRRTRRTGTRTDRSAARSGEDDRPTVSGTPARRPSPDPAPPCTTIPLDSAS